MRTSTACSTLEGVDVECTHCGVRMTSHVGSGGQIRYFQYPGCQRWSTSVYTEVFKADTKLRTRKPLGEEPQAAFGSVKERLSRWLECCGGGEDPWRTRLRADGHRRSRSRAVPGAGAAAPPRRRRLAREDAAAERGVRTRAGRAGRAPGPRPPSGLSAA